MNDHFQEIFLLFDSSNWGDELSDSSPLLEVSSMEEVARLLALAHADGQRDLPWARCAPESAELTVRFKGDVILLGSDKRRVSYLFDEKVIQQRRKVRGHHEWGFQESSFYAIDRWDKDDRIVSVATYFEEPPSKYLDRNLPHERASLVISFDLNAGSTKEEYESLIEQILDGVVRELATTRTASWWDFLSEIFHHLKPSIAW